MTTTSPLHSFHAPYSKSKLARGIQRQGKEKKRKEKTRKGKKGKGKNEVKKRKEKGNKVKKKGDALYTQSSKLCLNSKFAVNFKGNN